jgi:hypothetical protein
MTIADTDVLIDYVAGKGEADAVERLLDRGALRTTVNQAGASIPLRVESAVQHAWVPSSDS